MSKIQERVYWITPNWSIIFQMNIRNSLSVVFPTLIIFPRGSEGPYLDLTFTWLRFGITFRRE